MDKSLHQVESLPESFIPGGVYFDKETGGVYVAQDSSTKKQFGGTVTGISAPQPEGFFTESNLGIYAVQKVSNTSSQGSTNVLTSIVYINGTKLVAMGDGDTISYGGNLFSFLQFNMAQGKLFMLSTTDQGNIGFGGRLVVVESLGSTVIISLVSHGTSHNKIIRWTVTSSNQVTRNDTVLSYITVDSSLSSTSTNPVQNKVIKAELKKLLPLAGGEMSGPITFSTASTSNKPNNYVSSGGGYGTGSGKYGLKLLSIDAPDAQAGIGQDLTGRTYETCIAAAQNPNIANHAYITFAKHLRDTKNYTKLGEIDGSGNLHMEGEVYANGVKCLTSAPKVVIGQSTYQSVLSPVQGYKFSKRYLKTANPTVGETLINYENNQLMIGEIIRVETNYIYTGINILFIPIPSAT